MRRFFMAVIAVLVAVPASAQQPDLDPTIARAVGLLRAPITASVYLVDPVAMHIAVPASGAFRAYRGGRIDPNIYVNQNNSIYLDAKQGNDASLRILAAMIAHEQEHSASKGERRPCAVEMATIDRMLLADVLSDETRAALMLRKQAIQQYAAAHN